MNRLATTLFAASLLLAAGCPSDPDPRHYSGDGTLLGVNGQPLGGATVRVTGCDDQLTLSDGTFLVGCAPATYDVAVRYGNLGLVYQGLTRRDPVLVLTPFFAPAPHSGTVAGTPSGLSGGDTTALVALSSAEYSAIRAQANWTAGNFSISPSWFSAGSLAATVHALEWTPATGMPTSFTRFGSLAATVAVGGAVTASPALAANTGGSLTVSTDAADGTDLDFTLWIGWPGGGATQVFQAASGTSGATVPTPDVAGAQYAVVAQQGTGPWRWGWRRGLAMTATPAEIALPAAAPFTAPASGTTVECAASGCTTDFSFAPVAGAVNLVSFEPVAGGSRARFVVVTTQNTVRIPNLAWAGLPITATESYLARVRVLGPIASVDDAATASGGVRAHPAFWYGTQANAIPGWDGFATEATLPFSTP